MIMNCQNCGGQIPQGTAFCPNCGAQVQQAPVQPVQPVQPVPGVMPVQPVQQVPVQPQAVPVPQPVQNDNQNTQV